VTPPAVHVSLAQHGWPGPPHVPQLPDEHEPVSIGHMLPLSTQTSFTQQPPPQSLPAQQAWPGEPQTAHTPWLQTEPVSQERPRQHVSPAEPHAAQTPWVQTALESEQVWLPQHAAPRPHSPPWLQAAIARTATKNKLRIAPPLNRRHRI
jgi:hypothetical protein